MRDKIVNLALSQVGTKETYNNNVKYNTWYYGKKVNGSAYAWCAVFVSWLANECEIIKKLIPKFSGCGTGVNWFKNKGQWLEGGKKPNRGDLIFFKPTKTGAISSHVGIVVDVNDKSVTTVEGNKSDQVKKCTYSLGFSSILGYGQVKYTDDNNKTEDNKANVKYVYNCDSLNIRKGAGTKYSAINDLICCTKVTVYETKSGWARIGTNQWVAGNYLTSNKPNKIYETKEVTTELNVRTTNSFSGYKNLATSKNPLPKGTIISVLKISGSGVQIGQNRWVYKAYLK